MRYMAQKKGKELGQEQSKKFLRMIRVNSWKEAPSKAELQSVYDRLGGRMKRRKGTKTPLAELRRRIRARGTFAKSWRISKVIEQPTRIRIWIVDTLPYAGAVESKSHPAENAAKSMESSFRARLEKYAQQVRSTFQ